MGVKAVVSKAFESGGSGSTELAEEVCRACETDSTLKFTYPDEYTLKQKIETLATKIYRADGVDYTPAALSSLAEIEAMGYGSLPVCVAKTQYSISDNPLLLGCPSGYRLTVREVKVSSGAGFVVVLAGTIMTMPGLPKKPAAESIDIDNDGVISGLF